MSLSYLDALYGVISCNAAIMSMINNKLFKEKKIEGSNNDFKESNKSFTVEIFIYSTVLLFFLN